MLAEDINEKTEWKVTVHPWSGGWAGSTHRLLVKHKPIALEEMVRQIQILGVNQGKLLNREKIEATLHTILNCG